MTRLTWRSYQDADLPDLQAAVASWIREAGRCEYDHIGELPHRIYENLRGRRPVGELVQVWGGADGVAGIAINMRMGCCFDVFAARGCGELMLSGRCSMWRSRPPGA